MLARSVTGGALPGSIIVLLDQLLLVLLIVELLSAPHRKNQTKRAMIWPPRIFM